MTNNVIKRKFNGTRVVLTLEESFSDSPYPDSMFCYIVRGIHTDGSVTHVGYNDREIADSDFDILVARELEELPIERLPKSKTNAQKIEEVKKILLDIGTSHYFDQSVDRDVEARKIFEIFHPNVLTADRN